MQHTSRVQMADGGEELHLQAIEKWRGKLPVRAPIEEIPQGFAG
jgi:hypothetical protein